MLDNLRVAHAPDDTYSHNSRLSGACSADLRAHSHRMQPRIVKRQRLSQDISVLVFDFLNLVVFSNLVVATTDLDVTATSRLTGLLSLDLHSLTGRRQPDGVRDTKLRLCRGNQRRLCHQRRLRHCGHGLHKQPGHSQLG